MFSNKELEGRVRELEGRVRELEGELGRVRVEVGDKESRANEEKKQVRLIRSLNQKIS